MANTSNSKKYAALWLNSQGKSPKEIAEELSMADESVEKILAEAPPPPQNDTAVVPINSKNLMITHTSGKKSNTVAIMTREASELNDAKKKKIPDKPITKGIYRPKSNEQ
jgi:hypothetical protein